MKRAALAPALVGLALALGAGGCPSNGGGRATPTPAPAATFPGAKKIAEAQTLAAGGQLADAADTLAEGMRELEEAGPLRIRNLTVVSGAVRGYGLYEPSPGGALRPGEPLVLYFEPVGFARRRQGALWEMEMEADVTIRDLQGTPIVSQQGVLKSVITSQQPNRELQFTLKLNLSDPPSGDFIAEVVLHDHVGGEKARGTVTFRVP